MGSALLPPSSPSVCRCTRCCRASKWADLCLVCATLSDLFFAFTFIRILCSKPSPAFMIWVTAPLFFWTLLFSFPHWCVVAYVEFFFFLRIVGALCSFPVLLSLALIIFSLFPALANKQTWRAAPIQHSPDTQKHTPKKKKRKQALHTLVLFIYLFIYFSWV